MSAQTGKSQPKLVGIAILLAVILFLSVNVISTNLLRSERLDLTENSLYSLSEGTWTLLGQLEEPLHFRFFLSENLIRSAPQLSAYAKRVRSLLETYANRAEGRITLEIIDPEPFSDAEDRAVGLGINRIQLPGVADPLFFGLSVTNSTDGHQNIPIFAPDREAFLEYDLTRLVAKLGQTGKPTITIFDGLGLSANPRAQIPEQQLLSQLKDMYEVKILEGDVDKLPESTRVVLVIHPQGLADRTLFTLDQWALGGGAMFVFLDPHAETQIGGTPGMPPVDAASDFARLLDAWGVEFDSNKTVADPVYAIRMPRDIGGRQIEVQNYPWLMLLSDSMDQSDAAVSQLTNMILTVAGSFRATRDDVSVTPLITASPDAGFVDTSVATDRLADPRRLLSAIEKPDYRIVIAGRISGRLKTAFPDGKPDGSETTGDPRKEIDGKANIILVGDADMLMDRNWIQQRQLFGKPVIEAFANNGDFVLNALEQMIGGVALADLRGRGISWRPFERIIALENEAEEEYRAKEQELVAHLQETERKIRELDTGAGERDGTELFSEESFQAIDRFRADLLSTRAQLREVQHELRRDVDRLKTWITAANVGLFPAIFAICALGFALRKRRRAVPGRKPDRAV